MISALLALSLNLAVAPQGPDEGASPRTAAPLAVRSDRPALGLGRRAVLREKTGGHSRTPQVTCAAACPPMPVLAVSLFYSDPLVIPARPAATPSSPRDPPSRDPSL
jgi:hypothetical protein